MKYRDHVRKGLASAFGNLGNLAFALIRNKLLAVALGPAGLGWVALVNNLNETGAIVSGMGVCDALNRELARRKSAFTATQIVSTGLAIVSLSLLLVVPVIAVVFLKTVPPAANVPLALAGLAIASVSAASWRFLSGIYQGLGLSRAMFHTLIWAAVLNLVVTAIILAIGTPHMIVYVLSSPLALCVVAGIGLRRQLPALIDRASALRLVAWRPIAAIAAPIIIGLALEPLTAFYVRSTAAAHFGEEAVGMLQPGLQFVNLGASFFNAFVGMTLVRWDQSDEPAWSRSYKLLLAAAFAIPVAGIGVILLLGPLWPLLIRLLFSSRFLPGTETVAWFLAGEVLRMGGAILNHTFLSRKAGTLTLFPRLACLGCAFAALQLGFSHSLVAISQAYALAYLSYFVLSVLLWIGMQVRLQRSAA